MITTVKTTRQWTLWNDTKVQTIRVKRGESVWQLSDVQESYDPMDRVGGPFRIDDFVDDDENGKFFLIVIHDCAFPPVVLVRVNGGTEGALEAFCDWVTDGCTPEHPEGMYGLSITPDDEKDYEPDFEGVHFNSNGMVDTSSLHIFEAQFHSAEA